MQFPPPLPGILPGDLIHNFPVISLIFANSVTIVLAILGNWDLATVLFIYWSQSIIIGIFTVVSLLSANTAALAADFEKPGQARGGQGTVNTRHIWFYKCFLARVLHPSLRSLPLGVLHLYRGIRALWNRSFLGSQHLALLFTLLCKSPLLVSHLPAPGSKGAIYLMEQFFRPYQRIIPMHLTIIFGSIVVFALQVFGIQSTMPALVLFLFLKTYFDISTHLIKHAEEKTPYDPSPVVLNTPDPIV